MPTLREQKEKARRIQAAMFPLIGDTRFLEFVEVLRDLREQAVAFAVSHDSVKDARATTRTLGEIAAYNDIIGVADNYKAQLDEQQAMAEEAKQNEQSG